MSELWDRWIELLDEDVTFDNMFIGAATVSGDGGDWVFAVEICGTHGVYSEFMEPVSTGGRAVTHLRTGAAKDYFAWWENGEVMTRFEPLFPYSRRGKTPDALVDLMAEVGFDLRDDADRSYETHTEAAFALAERLSGVQITKDLMEHALYWGGIVEIPDP